MPNQVLLCVELHQSTWFVKLGIPNERDKLSDFFQKSASAKLPYNMETWFCAHFSDVTVPHVLSHKTLHLPLHGLSGKRLVKFCCRNVYDSI